MLPSTTIVGNLSDHSVLQSGVTNGKEWHKRTFLLLVDSYEGGNNVTHAFPVVHWGIRASKVNPMKGDTVQVQVQVRDAKWTDNNGITHYKHEFVVQDIKIIRRAQANKVAPSSYDQFSNNIPQEAYTDYSYQESYSVQENPVSDEDIPF